MPDALIVEADGGSRGNPGVAGYGALVRDAATGRVLAERAAPLGKQSNNVAEYTGLVEGLRAAYELAPSAAITVRMDSKLVVEQMSGRWKIKHEDMRRLALEAREVCRQVESAGGSVVFEWIPREANKAADALSNKGMDGLTIHRDLTDPPADPPVLQPAAPTADPTVTITEPSDAPAPPPPALTGSTRLILVRHGVTDFTTAGRLDGRGGADPGLDATGHAQAETTADAVSALLTDPDATAATTACTGVTVIASSLRRAQQTAAPIADRLGLPIQIDSDWDEQGFGDWDGAAFADLATEHPAELTALRRDPAYARPGGESQRDLTARVHAAYRRALTLGGTVVVVTHRKPILVLLAELLGMPDDKIWSFAIAPASLTGIEIWPDGNLSVAFTNRTGHLPD